MAIPSATINKTKYKLAPMAKLLASTRENLPRSGDIVSGAVVEKQPRRLFIDLGMLGMGIVAGTEYIQARDVIKNLEPGQNVPAKIVSLDNGEGYIEVSLREAGVEQTWQELKRLKDEKIKITTKVIDANRGGLLLEANGVRGFLPVSQLSVEHYPRVEGGEKSKILEHLKDFIGKDLTVRILDLSVGEEKLIFSEKGANEEDLKESLKNYKVGDVVEGEITAVANFGVFIKFGEPPLEGLIHISELDYKLIDDPKSIVNVGDKVQAKIISMENDRISLSLKALKEDPWSKVDERYQRGQVYPGTVKKISHFGALVELDPAIHGLCHISQFENPELLKTSLELGKEYKFAILDIQAKDRRLSLKLEIDGTVVSPSEPQVA